MPRRTDLLDRIQIQTPCDADWDTMVGNDQVRFCSHCELAVANLSSMKRTDARRLVRKSEGRLCVRFYRRPDGSPRAAPTARLHQIARRASRVTAGAFGAVLTLSAGAFAQTGPQSGADSQSVAARVTRASAGVADARESVGASLTGTVLDPNGAVIVNAEVTAVNADTQQVHSTITNAEGVYRFESLATGTYTLAAAAPGFVVGEVKGVELRQGAERRQNATLDVQGPQEVVEVTAEVQSMVMGGAMISLPRDPLVLAASRDDLKVVKELLAVGADVNRIDEATDTTALVEAVEHGDEEMVLTLLGAGADVNLRDSAGHTALMSLTDDASADVARSLLASGARVNLRDEDGDTALTLAAGRVKEDVLRVLIEAGAKVNARNKDGRTALMSAAEEGLLENVRALLVNGADVSRKDEDGDTALKMAKDGEHEEVVGLLVAYGAVE